MTQREGRKESKHPLLTEHRPEADRSQGVGAPLPSRPAPGPCARASSAGRPLQMAARGGRRSSPLSRWRQRAARLRGGRTKWRRARPPLLSRAPTRRAVAAMVMVAAAGLAPCLPSSRGAARGGEGWRCGGGARRRRGQPLSPLRRAAAVRGPLTELGRGAMAGVGRRLRAAPGEPRF